MKPDGIQRAVRANRHDRSAGDAPNLGRLARMPGTGLPKGMRRRRKRSERSRNTGRNVVLNWSILFGAFAVLSLIAAVYFWLQPKMETALAADEAAPTDREETVRIRSKFDSPTESTAIASVKAALGIRATEEIPAHFHLGTADPARVVDFLKNLETNEGQIERYQWLGSMDANNLQIDGVLVVFNSAAKLRQRMAFLTPDEKGVWKIDFDAFARTVSPSWSDLENGAEQAIVRVFLGADSYFNGPFKDDQWLCYGMAAPDTEQLMLGYCKVDSPQAAAIQWIFSKGTRINRATLEIRRVEGASPKQFEIVRVLAEDWVMGEKPFDEGFK